MFPVLVCCPMTSSRQTCVQFLLDIQDGTFASKWIAENKNGRSFFNSKRDQLAKHPMEIVGKLNCVNNMLWKDGDNGDKGLDAASN